MGETTSTDIRRCAKAVYLATPENVAQEIERQLLTGADAMDRLAEAEALLRETRDVFVNKLWDADNNGIPSAEKVARYYAVKQSEKIDAFLSGKSRTD